MKRLIGIIIMMFCLFGAALAPALAEEAPGQASPAMAQPAASAPAAAPASSAPVTQKALDDLKSSNGIGCGAQGGYTESYRGAFTEVNLLDKVRFEIAVNDEFVKPTVEAIIKGARTGKIGDGKIFVVPLEECIQVRTGETGPKAVG